ncbi:MAG: asparagine synthase (glutamine-hydrolyzing) [Thioploca sp.]|nr:asparagine synthase (glutamine-hydrolyzing) [Thioploca sp.]
MCGIAGLFDSTSTIARDALNQTITKMGNRLVHRGPDTSGVWVDEKVGIAFVHRRLSIIDISPAGHQPMVSHDGRYVITFNGEIYNFLKLRRELEHKNISWHGHSDTEVFLSAISQWGIKTALQKSVGMFAFALWDRKNQELTLARDRLGEKPLYYGYIENTFIFASELKAIRGYSKFNLEIDRTIIPLYLRHNYIPTPYSIYKGIYKLPPGCYLTIQDKREICPFQLDGYEKRNLYQYSPIPYWSLSEITQKGLYEPFSGTIEEATTILEQLLNESVRGQMIADVPLGAFLSGGIDSSTVVAVMQANSHQPVRTFSIGFHEENYNEANYAKAVAQHLGTDHTELYVTANEAIAVIPQLPSLYDEPFADSSQIPTYLLSNLTRNYVTVSLSGDGGDELFCGYSRYFLSYRLWNLIKWVPALLRMTTSQILLSSPETLLNWVFFWLLPIMRQYGNTNSSVGYNLHRVAELIGATNPVEFYQQVMSHWKQPLLIIKDDSKSLLKEPKYIYNRSNGLLNASKNPLRQMMLIDSLSYLPDDILVKVDRATMANSLESRIPLLDHRIVEFVATLPIEMNYQAGVGKQMLRQILYRYVPKNLVERQKMGFGVPLDSWLRKPLRTWAESLLDETRLKQEGYFCPKLIREKWQEHLSGKRNWHYELWDILMFQAWLEQENNLSK